VLPGRAAGSPVILKPAPETRHTARELAACFWKAGVPEDLFQLLPCDDDDAGRRLITHEDVDAVILTGAYDTARLFLDWAPAKRVHAETSGKNALVITAAADLDAAVKDLVRSAFGHAGQKCSAASLAILEASVYDDERFRRTLKDAVTSLKVGHAHDLSTRMGPLIRPPEGPLRLALTRLEPGEEWLVEPEQLDRLGCLWRPGVKLGVQPGSMFHLTECFGPVLGLMRANDLDHAIEMQNAVPYGLTAGIHSLDAAETRQWAEQVEAGNLYINRHITGAVVQRQPFGGWKRSSVGPTFKAGGPNYVLSLGRWRHHHDQLPLLTDIADSFNQWWKREFSQAHDPSDLQAESNVLRYRPYRRGVLVHVGPGAPVEATDVCRLASQLTGTPMELTDHGRLLSHDVDKLRILGDAPDQLRREALAHGMTIDDSPLCGHGRIELLRWLREQSVSETRHRYGNPRPSATLAVTASRLRAVGEV
jgi:RHH-type proline utilization regulon transcriptional repressor/proline dehydrogenase/delta 1-pyrroline-5-carboxylate dehydrogenase